jgi:hypothetical protein
MGRFGFGALVVADIIKKTPGKFPQVFFTKPV